MKSAEVRYRVLLDASSAIADQPTVKAILQSLRGVLSGTCRIHGAHLYVLSADQASLQVLAFDQDADAPNIKLDTRVLRVGAVERVLETQKPVFIRELAKEMLKHPDLAPFADQSILRTSYLFPVSTAQRQYGILAVTKDQGDEFLSEDVELLETLANHVAVALECALARDTAEAYQREAVRERDKLKLLLEINNHIVTKLEVDELLPALAASIRKHLENHSTSVWLINKPSESLVRRFLDFPTGK